MEVQTAGFHYLTTLSFFVRKHVSRHIRFKQKIAQIRTKFIIVEKNEKEINNCKKLRFTLPLGQLPSFFAN